MCLPVKLLKKVLGLFAVLIFIIGVAGIAGASYNLSKSGDMFNNYGWSWGNAISGLLLALALFTTLTGIFGMYGGFK